MNTNTNTNEASVDNEIPVDTKVIPAVADSVNAKVAYGIFGLTPPEKKTKAMTSKTGRKYKIGFREMKDLVAKFKPADIDMENPVDTSALDSESYCRTYRCYIAYKIGHVLREVISEDGVSNFVFGNRTSKENKCFSVNLSDANGYDYLKAFYQDCMSEITDAYGIFNANGKTVLFAVNAGNEHFVLFAKPESK